MVIERLKHFNTLFFLLWLIIATVIWVVSDYQQHDVVAKAVSIATSLGVLIVSTYVLCNFLLPKTIERNKVYWTVAIVLAMAVCQGVLLYLCEEFLVFLNQRGIITLEEELRDDFLSSIISVIPVALFLDLGFGGLRFFYEHAKLSEKHHLLQKNLLESQIAALQAQVNPHFMFNVLNHIHILMQTNVEESSTLLLKYADMLRYQLYEGNKEWTSLNTEIAFLKDFIEIERMRWNNRLAIETSWNVRNGQDGVSPLLFFTLLENAFKYVYRPADGQGFVRVKMEQKVDCIILFVENSISNLDVEKKKNNNGGLGLSNLRRRLELLYPKRYELDIKRTSASYIASLVIYT